MKYSIRTLLLVLLAFAVLCAFYYRVFVLPLKADQPFATKVLENGLEIRLWAKPNFYSSVKPDISKAQSADHISSCKSCQKRPHGLSQNLDKIKQDVRRRYDDAFCLQHATLDRYSL